MNGWQSGRFGAIMTSFPILGAIVVSLPTVGEDR